MGDHGGLIIGVGVGAGVVLQILDCIGSEEGPEIRRTIQWMMNGVVVLAALCVVPLILKDSHSWEAWIGVVVLLAAVGGFCYAGVWFTEREIARAKFCDTCLTTVYQHGGASSDRFCAKCGTELRPIKTGDGGENLLE